MRQAWDETVRVIASIHDRIVSASLILHRLGSYARQNSVHQALAEIGRVHKTIHILRTLDDEELIFRIGFPFAFGDQIVQTRADVKTPRIVAHTIALLGGF